MSLWASIDTFSDTVKKSFLLWRFLIILCFRAAKLFFKTKRLVEITGHNKEYWVYLIWMFCFSKEILEGKKKKKITMPVPMLLPRCGCWDFQQSQYLANRRPFRNLDIGITEHRHRRSAVNIVSTLWRPATLLKKKWQWNLTESFPKCWKCQILQEPCGKTSFIEFVFDKIAKIDSTNSLIYKLLLLHDLSFVIWILHFCCLYRF